MPFRSCAAGDFDADELARAKREAATSVSVCLPARDEEATVGAIVAAIRRELVVDHPLVDEVLVLDDRSRDRTAEVATAAGARVVPVDGVLPEAGSGEGKGNALWASLFASAGDVVAWVDADIRGFDPAFVVGLLGPLLTRTEIAFVKGFYRRPSADDSRGGRVTELVARPLLSRFFPVAARFVQPLAGEYAGRRALLERLPFVEGWGVDLALLVDAVERGGADAIAQVDLGVRAHRNRPLDELAPQAAEILATVLLRAGVDSAGTGADLVRFDDSHRPERVPVRVAERPPMIEVPAYRSKFGKELSA